MDTLVVQPPTLLDLVALVVGSSSRRLVEDETSHSDTGKSKDRPTRRTIGQKWEDGATMVGRRTRGDEDPLCQRRHLGSEFLTGDGGGGSRI